MKNYSDVQDRIFAASDEAMAKAELEVKRLQVRKNEFLKVLGSISLHDLNKCFDKLKLDARVVSMQQRDVPIEELASTGIVIGIRATPLRGCAIKPVVFTHYTKSGSSATGKQRYERARNLEAKIHELTGYECRINEFSMEVESKDDDFSIMIDLIIPHPSKVLIPA